MDADVFSFVALVGVTLAFGVVSGLIGARSARTDGHPTAH